MKSGVVAQIGTPSEIYYHPNSEFVADFIGEANFLKGRMLSHDGTTGLMEIQGVKVEVADAAHIADGKDATLVLRPESAVLGDQGFFPCKVVLSCFMGAYQNYHVMVGDTKVAITDYNPKGRKVYQVGETAYLSFKKENVHVL